MRRLKRYFPIVLIALLVQLIAPIGACWAVSLAASDPLSGALICSQAFQSDQTDPGAAHDGRNGSCSACCVAQPAAPVDHPTAADAPPQPRVCRITWQAGDTVVAGARDGSHAQARAPPLNS